MRCEDSVTVSQKAHRVCIIKTNR